MQTFIETRTFKFRPAQHVRRILEIRRAVAKLNNVTIVSCSGTIIFAGEFDFSAAETAFRNVFAARVFGYQSIKISQRLSLFAYQVMSTRKLVEDRINLVGCISLCQQLFIKFNCGAIWISATFYIEILAYFHMQVGKPLTYSVILTTGRQQAIYSVVGRHDFIPGRLNGRNRRQLQSRQGADSAAQGWAFGFHNARLIATYQSKGHPAATLRSQSKRNQAGNVKVFCSYRFHCGNPPGWSPPVDATAN